MDLTTCPDCGSIAEVLDRFVLESTAGPVEHARTRCINRDRPAPRWLTPCGSGSRVRARECPTLRRRLSRDPMHLWVSRDPCFSQWPGRRAHKQTARHSVPRRS